MVKWDRGGTESVGDIHFYMKRGMKIMYLGWNFFFVHKRIISAVKRLEMSYITLGGCWCDIIVLNVHASTENKSDTKDSFYKELEHVFHKFSK
jgi:hypothetical protein